MTAASLEIGTVRCVQAARAILGEGPVWDPEAACLFWVDIERPAIYRFRPLKGQSDVWRLQRPVGCVAPAGPDRLMVADAGGFAWLDLVTGELTRIADPEPDQPLNRFNDGKVDRAGRFWAGTLYDRSIRPAGSLYRLDATLAITKMAAGFTCPNGIGWSPDNRTMYFTDSMVRTIWAYEFDFTSGELGTRRIFAQLEESDGLPDGLTVDSEGCVWSAIWDGWRVVRYTPEGSVDRQVSMPVQRPTSCMFGGEDLRTLYVTSASRGLGPEQALAGGLFAFETRACGIAEVSFGSNPDRAARRS